MSGDPFNVRDFWNRGGIGREGDAAAVENPDSRGGENVWPTRWVQRRDLA
jgi:hypothetical protein